MNEVRESIQGIFDYCGDIKRNGNSNNYAQYSANFSPNNIRTVVISAEGVLVRLHKPYTGALPKGVFRISNKVMYIGIIPYKLYKVVDGNTDFGTPTFRMLAKPVYACIEEIIILKGVANEAYYQFVGIMESYDLNRSDLLKDYSKSGDQHADIAKRFGRLHKIASVNLNFVSFVNSYKQHRDTIEQSHFLCDSLKNYILDEETFNEEWWNSIAVQTSTYPMDSDLKVYFEGIKAKYEKDAKDAKVQAFKDEKYKKDAEGLDYAIERYVSLCSVPMKMRAIVMNGEANGVVDGLSYPSLQYDKVVDYPGFPKGIRDSFIDKDTKLSPKEAIQHNKEVVGSTSKLVTLTSTALFENLYKLHQISPVTLAVIADKIKEKVSNNQISIIVPNECKSMLEEMKPELGNLEFVSDGKKMAQSVVNAVWLFSICFIDNNTNTSKYNEHETWSNMVARKGDKS